MLWEIYNDNVGPRPEAQYLLCRVEMVHFKSMKEIVIYKDLTGKLQ